MMNPEVRNLMTKNLVTIQIGKTTDQAKALMAEKRIRHLPVIDEMDDVIGILSARDLKNINSPNVPVEFAMATPVEYVYQGATLRSAILKMLEMKISCLLVADLNENAVGIITTDDLLWHLAEITKDDDNVTNLLSRETIGNVVDRLNLMGI